jgi:hypothetical protein
MLTLSVLTRCDGAVAYLFDELLYIIACMFSHVVSFCCAFPGISPMFFYILPLRGEYNTKAFQKESGGKYKHQWPPGGNYILAEVNMLERPMANSPHSKLNTS